MNKFNGFKFVSADINQLPDLSNKTTIESYDVYGDKKFFLYDPDNNRLVKVKTSKNFTEPNFLEDILTAYKFVYNIRWSGSLTNKQKLKVEDAKFIFEQAEKYLKDSIDTSGTILVRVNTIITIVVAIIVALSSYIVSELKVFKGFNSLLITSSIGLLYFYILGFFAVRNIYPTPYFPVGSLPKDLFSDNFFLDTIPDEDRIIRYYVSETENYQYRIERNNYINGNRWTLYKRTLWALLSAPIVFFFTYCIVIIF